jgi:hypothetical protein
MRFMPVSLFVLSFNSLRPLAGDMEKGPGMRVGKVSERTA